MLNTYIYIKKLQKINVPRKSLIYVFNTELNIAHNDRIQTDDQEI